MGRYYNGDIEGKFWFGVQASDDADFFGVTGQSSHIDYYFDEDNLEDIELGIKQCKEALGENKAILDEFFDTHDSYNDDMIVQFFKFKHDIVTNEKFIRTLLGWYARLELGNQIWECVKENGQCNFEAEL